MVSCSIFKTFGTGKTHQNTQLRFKPSYSTFYALITSYVCINRVSDVVDVDDEMSKTSVKPNEVIYDSG